MKETIQKISLMTGENWTVVFGEFLRYVIAGFSVARRGIDWKFGENTNELFNDLLGEWAKESTRGIAAHGWCDVLGDLYESMSLDGGNQKQRAQFFTPSDVTDLMAGLSDGVEDGGRPYDPTCGSGRTLLAYLAKFPSKTCRGEDIDPTACRMCTCNLLIHGFTGEVICHDVLLNGKVKFAYRINGHFRQSGHPLAHLPHIERIM